MTVTQATLNKGTRRDTPLKAALCYAFFAACMVGSGFIIHAASDEDKRQEAYSNRYYAPAVQDYQAHHYQAAAVRLQANLRAFPDDYDANFEMGLVLLGMGKKQDARTYFVNAQNSFLSHHGRFSEWKPYNMAQHEIDRIDKPQK